MDSYLPRPMAQALAAIGLLYISVKLFSFVRVLLSLFVLPGASLSKFGRKGTWAVVTGASDGIGKEYATQLADKGFNIVLVSRTQSKLDTLARELESKYASVQTKTVAMDFAQNRDSDYDMLKRHIADLDISILINNVGLSHDIP
ncbi:hypothetical protein LTR16_009524, partial [Cryomyces antarcticus]